ncbi:hypothetical protein [Priestia megaterium]|uniref:hypothetical protein n=1 Tax=Priestia megaterium TaxID=1404 RepID=UPI0036D914CF
MASLYSKKSINGGSLTMGNCKKHSDGDSDIRDLIELLKSETNRIEKSFESIEKLLEKNEKLAEQLLGIRAKRGKY